LKNKSKAELIKQVNQLNKKIKALENQRFNENKNITGEEKKLYTQPEGILILDREGKHINVNDTLCKMTGYTRKELIGYPAEQTYISKASRAEFKTITNVNSEIDGKNYEINFQYKNGPLFPVILYPTLIPHTNDFDQHFLITVKDVSGFKKAEEEFLLNQFIIDKASISIFMICDNAKIKYVNKNACETLGYSKDELCSMTVFDIDPSFPKDKWPDFEEYISNKKSNVLETIHKRKDGSTFPVYITADYLKYQGKNYSISFARDISEQKQALSALKESENRYRLLFELESDAIFLIDNKTGHILEANEAAAQMYGYTRDELTNKKNTDLSAEPTDTRKVTTTTQPKADQIIKIPLRYHRKKDGTVFPVEITGRFFLTKGRSVHIAAIRDITERLQSEEQMKNLAKFPEENPNPVLRISNESKIIYANQASSILLKYWQTGINQFLPEKHKETIEKVLKQSMNINVEVETEKRTYVLVFTPIQEDHYVNIYGLDITDQKLLEEQLRQSQKMEAIGHLAGGIAHDFNNLLTVINGYSELIIGDLDKNNSHYDKIIQIQQSGQRAESLTRQLLAFSRKQILQPVSLDVNNLLHKMEKMLERIIGEDIILETDYDKNLKPIKADPGQIEQVIINLIINSRDAMPNGGVITIETANVMLDEEYVMHYGDIEPGIYVLISVRDEGIGMDKSILPHIFEPFFTTKDEHKGTGLGLSTVYGIIKQSEGHIDVRSQPGSGTTVHIYLKTSDQKITDVYKIPESQIDLEGKETILVVEDEQAVREFTVLTLQRFGYNVLEASGAKEALNLIKNNKKPVDVVLTDVIMPGMSGKELAALIQQSYKSIKIIYMSGYTNEAMVHQGVLDNGMHFIQKPFTSLSLLTKLRKVLTEKNDNK